MTVAMRAHLLAVAPDRAVLVVGQLLPQLAQLRDQPVLLDRVLDRDVERDLAEPFGVVGLDDVVGGAEADRLDDRRRLVAARQHDHLRLGPRGLQGAQRRHAVEPRHHDVEQDDVGRLGLLHRRQQFVAARIAPGLVSPQGKEGPQVLREAGIVINDGYVRFLHRVSGCCIQWAECPFRLPTSFKTRTSTERDFALGLKKYG